MAKNTNKDSRVGYAENKTQVKNPRTSHWTARDRANGKFTDVKENGGAFKGAAKESDRTAKRKALTLEVFNAIHDSHHKR